MEKPDKVYKQLQQLTRERDQIIQERSIIKNQLHAEKSEAEPHLKSLERMQQRIIFLNSQEKDIKKDITALINENPEIKQIIKRINTIPGIGNLSR